MIDLLICNTTIITVNQKHDIISNAAIAVSGGKVADIGRTEVLAEKYRDAVRIIDAEGKMVFPGLINIHTHSYQSLLKGLGDDKVLSDWLADMALPASSALDESSAYYGAALTVWENFHSGVTTIVDMYPRTETDISAAVMGAYSNSGIRAYFGAAYMHSDSEGTSALADIRRRVSCLLEKKADGRVGVMLAPFQVWNNSKASLEMTRELSRNYGARVTIHALETDYDGQTCMRAHGAGEIETLDRCGLLTPELTLIHGVCMSEAEMRLVAEHGVSVGYTPVCNMYLASGFAPAPEMLDAGVNVALGTEGAGCNNSNDMLETLKCAALVQKALHRDPKIITADTVLEMATIRGARALGMEDSIGSLEIGKNADMFIFDPASAVKAVPVHDPVSTLVYSSTQGNVDTVIVGGDVVMEGGMALGVNERLLSERSQDVADMLAERARISHLKRAVKQF